MNHGAEEHLVEVMLKATEAVDSPVAGNLEGLYRPLEMEVAQQQCLSPAKPWSAILSFYQLWA